MKFTVIRSTGLMFALLGLYAVNGVTGELTIPDNKAVIEFDAWPGAVTFAHKKHAELSITKCSTCHHKMLPEDTKVKACHKCHKDTVKRKTPKAREVFHTRCTGCHEYTIAGGQDAGPKRSKCKLCHIREVVN